MARTNRRSESGKTKGPARYFDIGLGFAVQWNPNVTVDAIDGVELPHHLDLELAVENGRLVCATYTARRRKNGPPVTADSLKQMPVVGAIGMGAPSIVRGRQRVPVSKADIDALPEVERAAVAYRIGFFFGNPPTAHVAKVLNVNRDVAAKRVQAARRKGLLEPTTKGKKGG